MIHFIFYIYVQKGGIVLPNTEHCQPWFLVSRNPTATKLCTKLTSWINTELQVKLRCVHVHMCVVLVGVKYCTMSKWWQ